MIAYVYIYMATYVCVFSDLRSNYLQIMLRMVSWALVLALCLSVVGGPGGIKVRSVAWFICFRLCDSAS